MFLNLFHAIWSLIFDICTIILSLIQFIQVVNHDRSLGYITLFILAFGILKIGLILYSITEYYRNNHNTLHYFNSIDILFDIINPEYTYQVNFSGLYHVITCYMASYNLILYIGLIESYTESFFLSTLILIFLWMPIIRIVGYVIYKYRVSDSSELRYTEIKPCV